jgi:protein-S-isoprenylcysteine O-methyltransferase Ste14
MADKNNINEPGKARWLISAFVALTVLIILFGLAFLISGREIIERPVLLIFVLFAWLGTLGGIALGRSTD